MSRINLLLPLSMVMIWQQDKSILTQKWVDSGSSRIWYNVLGERQEKPEAT